MDQILEQHPWFFSGIAVCGVIVLAWLISVVCEAIFKRPLAMLIARTKWKWDEELIEHGFFHRLAQLLIPVTTYLALPFIPGLSAAGFILLQNLISAIAILFVALAVSALLNTLQSRHEHHSNKNISSIKSYVQIGKLIVSSLALISGISVLIDKSPWILLSGLGAMSAVLLLVFRDTILSFVASVQLSTNDMLRVGDWIEMPQVGADGDVVDIALHTVKVQNWDNTITTIPTWRLIAESFKNWRAMQQSGGRRIKRSLRLDTHSVNFLNEEAIARLQQFKLLQEYLVEKCADIAQTNSALGADASVTANLRRLTNIGTFRAYALAYLHQNPEVHKKMMCMVRALEPNAEGVPIEVYCFTRSTEWEVYERIQGDIFDHLLAILPEFGLWLFQNPSGADFRGLKST